MSKSSAEHIAVIGLGYVGLPVAIELADAYEKVVGFDINTDRVAALKSGTDATNEVEDDRLKDTSLLITSDPGDMDGASFFIITVPTPIDGAKQPDLKFIESACDLISGSITKGAVVVLESTVYPGVTEDVCGPRIEENTGLKCGTDFYLGYSPERINPGDKLHTVRTIQKIVAGQDEATTARVNMVYSSIVDAGTYVAPSIKVAEAAKVLENTQRDLNIALMNEMALICDRLDISCREVIDAAATKWNFIPFTPGLVGGHCIGVDPYYLTAKAELLNYHPQVILSGRRVNDEMGKWVARRTVKLMVRAGVGNSHKKVGVLGMTFKENVPDIRNSKVIDIIRELRTFGIEPLVHDPIADAGEVEHEFGTKLTGIEGFGELDALVLAVNHKAYIEGGLDQIKALLKPNGVLVDVKSVFRREAEQMDDLTYWCL